MESVSFKLERGDSLGILGESGSGKSMTCKAVLGLLPEGFEVFGRIRFRGEDVLGMSGSRRRRLRGKEIGFIMQNPMTAFDPLCTIGAQMAETLTEHLGLSAKEALGKAAQTLERMQLRMPERILRQYPHELSGGMLQRVMIGLTLALEPGFIIADEPTTALDVITQAEILGLFRDMKERLRCSMVFVTHDLGVIAKVADNILVMHGGLGVEYGPAGRLLRNPASEHSRYLLQSRMAVMRRFHREIGGLAGRETACEHGADGRRPV